MWRETESQYRAAAEALIKVKTGKDVQVQTVAQGAPDFSQGAAAGLLRAARFVTLDRQPWEEKVRLYTRSFRASPAILNSIVTFTAQAQNQYQRDERGHKASVRPSALPAGALHPGQGARRNGHQPLLQFRLGRSGRGSR